MKHDKLDDDDIQSLAVVLDLLGQFSAEDGDSPDPKCSLELFLKFGFCEADGNKEEGGKSPSRLRERDVATGT